MCVYLLKIPHGRRAQIYKCTIGKDTLHPLNTFNTFTHKTLLYLTGLTEQRSSLR